MDKEKIILIILSWMLVLYVSVNMLNDMLDQLYSYKEDWYIWFIAFVPSIIVAWWITESK